MDVRGGGPGTRETDLLAPENTVQAIDALVGGSAFGSTQQPVYRGACAGRASHRKSNESKPAMGKSKAASAYDYQVRPDGLWQ